MVLKRNISERIKSLKRGLGFIYPLIVLLYSWRPSSFTFSIIHISNLSVSGNYVIEFWSESLPKCCILKTFRRLLSQVKDFQPN